MWNPTDLTIHPGRRLSYILCGAIPRDTTELSHCKISSTYIGFVCIGYSDLIIAGSLVGQDMVFPTIVIFGCLSVKLQYIY